MVYDILLSTIRLSLPLIFAAYGGMLSERAGVANIALEGYLLFSAFTGAAVTHLTQNLAVGMLAGILASGLIGFLFSLVCVYGRGDQIVVGTAFNFVASGIIPVLCRALFGVTGSTPSLPIDLRIKNYAGFGLLALGLVVYYHFVIHKTRYGLRMTAAGENPIALQTQGVNVHRLRIRAVTEGALIAGVGGVFLSLCLSSGYSREMSAGRGFIALAALIFGGWKPFTALAACLFFGFTDALQIQLQGQALGSFSIPNQFIQMIPYISALVVLVYFGRRIRAPGSINRDLETFTSN